MTRSLNHASHSCLHLHNAQHNVMQEFINCCTHVFPSIDSIGDGFCTLYLGHENVFTLFSLYGTFFQNKPREMGWIAVAF